MRALFAGLVVAALVASGCIGTSNDEGADTASTSPPPPAVAALGTRPHVVVAVIDTGINPYHTEFRDLVSADELSPTSASGATPSRAALLATLLPGYPAEGTRVVEVSLDLEDYDEAVDADMEKWSVVKTGELVTFPGTKVVGGISFTKEGMLGSTPDRPYVLDQAGHGTMVASRIAGNTISIGGPDVYLVSIQAGLLLDELESATEALNWAAEQDWIDIVSNSWGMPVPLGPAGSPYTGWTEAVKNLAAKKPTFFAAGNGLGNGIGSGYPSELQDNCTAEVFCVGGHDNGRFVYWPNWMPQISGDVLRNPSAEHDSVDEITNTGGGTSSATPFSAGGGAAMLLEARRILDYHGGVLPDGVLAVAGPNAALPASGPLADGDFTLKEFKMLLFRTAVVPQEDESDGTASGTSVPVPGQEMLPATLYPFFGYGEVNHDSIDAAKQVLRGEAEEPVRMIEDELFMRDYELRKRLYG